MALPPVPPMTSQGFQDPVWEKWLGELRRTVLSAVVATNITASAPLAASGSPTNITISQASAGSSGFLTSTDWNTFNGKVSSVSPAFTGTPTAPTAAADTSTTQIATTAFVLGQAGAAAPIVNGAAAAGTSFRYSRQDHVHPVDTSRQAAFTGLTTVITTAKLTIGGINGSMTFTNGVLTAQTAAT